MIHSFVPQNTEEELPSLPELCIKGYEPQGEWKRMGDWRVYCVRRRSLGNHMTLMPKLQLTSAVFAFNQVGPDPSLGASVGSCSSPSKRLC